METSLVNCDTRSRLLRLAEFIIKPKPENLPNQQLFHRVHKRVLRVTRVGR